MGRSQIPIVRSPCTLEWPRTQQVPAPGRPMWPPSRSEIHDIRMVATASRCWVRPIAQQRSSARERAMSRPARSISSRGIPQPSTISLPGRCLEVGEELGESVGMVANEVVIEHPTSAASSSASITFMSPLSSAMSPLIRTGRCMSASVVRRSQHDEPRSASGVRIFIGIGIGESEESHLRQRIDRDDLGPVLLGVLAAR